MRARRSPASFSPAASAGAWAASTRGCSCSTGKPLALHVIDRLAPQVSELLINANQNDERYAAFGHRVVPDAIPGFAGPLAGLHAALGWPWPMSKDVCIRCSASAGLP
jgi:hypothetical protein